MGAADRLTFKRAHGRAWFDRHNKVRTSFLTRLLRNGDDTRVDASGRFRWIEEGAQVVHGKLKEIDSNKNWRRTAASRAVVPYSGKGETYEGEVTNCMWQSKEIVTTQLNPTTGAKVVVRANARDNEDCKDWKRINVGDIVRVRLTNMQNRLYVTGMRLVQAADPRSARVQKGIRRGDHRRGHDFDEHGIALHRAGHDSSTSVTSISNMSEMRRNLPDTARTKEDILPMVDYLLAYQVHRMREDPSRKADAIRALGIIRNNLKHGRNKKLVVHNI